MAYPKLNIKFGKKTKSLAKFDVTFPNIVFAQLVASGFQPNEAAWVAFFGCDKLKTNEQLESKAQLCLENANVQELIKHLQTESVSGDMVGASLDEAIAQKISEQGDVDSETIVMEMLRMARNMSDGKERADMLMRAADLRGYRRSNADNKAAANYVGFVIPTQCHTCPCYKFAMDHGQDEDKKPLLSSRQ